jgi:hypothetical protein
MPRRHPLAILSPHKGLTFSKRSNSLTQFLLMAYLKPLPTVLTLVEIDGLTILVLFSGFGQRNEPSSKCVQSTIQLQRPAVSAPRKEPMHQLHHWLGVYDSGIRWRNLCAARPVKNNGTSCIFLWKRENLLAPQI